MLLTPLPHLDTQSLGNKEFSSSRPPSCGSNQRHHCCTMTSAPNRTQASPGAAKAKRMSGPPHGGGARVGIQVLGEGGWLWAGEEAGPRAGPLRTVRRAREQAYNWKVSLGRSRLTFSFPPNSRRQRSVYVVSLAEYEPDFLLWNHGEHGDSSQSWSSPTSTLPTILHALGRGHFENWGGVGRQEGRSR